jgi:hypothetical protein
LRLVLEFAACWRQQGEFLSTADAPTGLRWEATPRRPSAAIAQVASWLGSAWKAAVSS